MGGVDGERLAGLGAVGGAAHEVGSLDADPAAVGEGRRAAAAGRGLERDLVAGGGHAGGRDDLLRDPVQRVAVAGECHGVMVWGVGETLR